MAIETMGIEQIEKDVARLPAEEPARRMRGLEDAHARSARSAATGTRKPGGSTRRLPGLRVRTGTSGATGTTSRESRPWEPRNPASTCRR